ncbi:hypothetical protein MNBD_GAMMA02-1621 [hydrothermal vent metagenome]|uniref:Uncharacterized protein n=2 Tax=hydrothermal vent metagenome TaxID=652676 RepID=A0A3B0WSJ2_9ZZZZ
MRERIIYCGKAGFVPFSAFYRQIKHYSSSCRQMVWFDELNEPLKFLKDVANITPSVWLKNMHVFTMLFSPEMQFKKNGPGKRRESQTQVTVKGGVQSGA